MKPLVPMEVAGVRIQQDRSGRFCLNDLQRAAEAAGVTKDIRPNEWMALDHTKELAEVLITENPGIKPIHSVAGRYGGTYVVKELVYSYAMWISPTFNLRVIRAYDAMVTGAGSRVQAIDSKRAMARVLTDCVKESLEGAGKTPTHNDYSNEHRLVNFALTGVFGPVDEAALSEKELRLLADLRRRDAVINLKGLDYKARKADLVRYAMELRSKMNEALGKVA